MKAEKKIGVAIAGCGKIACTRHAPEYAANPHAEIIGFYDKNKERAEVLAQQYGGDVFETFEDLLKDERVQAVSICTPNVLHGTHTMQACAPAKRCCAKSPWRLP